jgi:hypothetical protein
MIFYRIHPEPLYTNPCIRKGPVCEKQLQPATALPLVSTGLLGEDVVALRNRKRNDELLDFWYGSLEGREAREEKEQGGVLAIVDPQLTSFELFHSYLVLAHE